MNTNNGHRSRLKEKYLKGGLDGFLDYEILELFLTYASPRKDCKAKAKALIDKFGSIEGVFNAPKEKVLEVEDMGESSYVLMKLFKDIQKYIFKEDRLMGKKISSTKELIEYLNYEMSNLEVEVFKIIFLNTQNVLINEKTIFVGTIDKSYIYPRELLKEIFEHNAKSVIFVHNHPSGNLNPSKADISFTNSMRSIFKELEINILDHIIIGKGGYFSFLEENLI
ncbi:MAG: DNA repair protein RadC [Fusobacteriaceae bacterium]|nr:DNA repair protein RadC [Fusobacteriaceae bacterium]MBN2839216.1 DNA repair protein RadC [Fusobacteriaceae bacterium]